MTAARMLFAPTLALLLAAACAPSEAPDPDGPSLDEIRASVLSAMDASADPCQDFYRYACGGWLDSTELPPDRARWGRGFSTIQERNLTLLREILEDPSPGSESARLAADFYAACMDEETIEAAGTAPIEPMLAQIDEVGDAHALMELAAHLNAVGIPAPFGLFVEADFKDPTKNILHLMQAGLGLPDRDYYLDPARSEIVAQYREHVARMLQLLGDTPERAHAAADGILAFETELAKASWRRQDLRDPNRIYNPHSVADLTKLAPGLDWKSYLTGIGLGDLESLNVAVPAFFTGLDALLADTPAETLHDYLRWHLVHAASDALPEAFVDESFAFYGKTLAGQKELRPRWKRCITATDDAVGEALGRAFVERAFAGDSKKRALDMIERIEASFATGLDSVDWMDETTCDRAKGKMAAIRNKIGFPGEWRDYSPLEIDRRDHIGNSARAAMFEFKREIGKVGKPVDPEEWEMTPPTVNAYYHPLRNEMVFPAGIMQPPFFERNFPAAMNFGGMGMVMGHELTHGFDDTGRKFDADGQLRDWWEPEAAEGFEKNAACVEKLYSGYEVQPGLHLNGKLTLGENIADLGGIKEAFHAYTTWQRDHGAGPKLLDELTDDQLFFVAFAQTWCTLATPEIERQLVTIDSHSPPRFRVNGPLSQYSAFAQAFSCAEGTPMNPAEKCAVW